MAKIFMLLVTVLILVALLLSAFPPQPAEASPDWWDANWQYRMKLTFDNTASGENLTNFPVLVHLTSTHSDFWSHINSSITTDDTKDLCFVDADDSTELYFEAERIDYASEDALIWVRVPQIDAGSTTDFIHIYYGNPAATQSAYHSASDVWDDNFVMVQHWHEGSGTTVGDSTANDNDGTIFGATGIAESGTNNTLTDSDKSWTTDEWTGETIEITGGAGSGQTRTVASNTATVITVSPNWATNPDATSEYYVTSDHEWTTLGKFNNAVDFDEVDDLIRVPDSASLDGTNDEGTFELWIWWDNAVDGDWQIVMSSSNRFTPGAKDGYEWASQGDGDHYFYPWGGTDSNYNLGLNPFTNQVWHYLVITFKDTGVREVEIHVDTVSMSYTIENVPTYWTTLASPDDWLWGGNPDRPTRYFDGMFDEVRISDTVRGDDWIEAQYLSMTDALITYRVEEELPLPVAGFSAEPTAGGAPLTIQFRDTSSGNVNSWLWNFGDGGTSQLRSPSHTYQDEGFYTVSLTASGVGGSDTEVKRDCIIVEAMAVPPELLIRNLQITPVHAQPRQAVGITANVVNEGGMWGSDRVILLINGQFEQSRSVGVSPGTAQPVSFTVYKVEPGEYQVQIGDATETFYVIEEQASSGRTTGSIPLGTGGIIAIVVIGIIFTAGIVVAFMFTRR